MKRKMENMDVDVSLRREIEKEQEQQDKGEKKRRKKNKEKKRKEDLVDVSLRKEIKEEQKLQEQQDQHSQEESPHIKNNKGEKKTSKKKKEKTRKEEPNMDFDVSLHREFEKEQELQEEDQHSQEENPHIENNKGEKKSSKKKKERKRKDEPNMDVDVSLHREIEKLQEQQEEDQHSLKGNPYTENNKGEKKRSKKKERERKEEPNMDFDVSMRREFEEKDQRSQEENPHTENNKGEKKRSKKKERKRKEEGDQHSDEGNLLRENNKGEEKRSKKKKEEEEEEKAETPSQKIPIQSSCGDHEQRKVKMSRKLLHLAKENGMGKDRVEGVVYKDKKMAKKAQDIPCKSGGEEGSNRIVEEDENTSSKTTKPSNKSRSSVQRGGYDPASNDDLLRNSIECSKEPLADQIEHVTNTSVVIDSSPKENEKEKKKERKRKRVTFKDQINVADQEHVRDIPNAACENSKETIEEVWGARFTPEEDEILKDAVWKYIKSKGWDEQEGLNKVFNSLKHKDARNCWADIKLSLPNRPRQAIRYRAHLLLEEGAHAGKWSEEEEQLLKRLQGEHGHKWREISSMLHRHRTSIKEKWRALKRTKGTGVWTQGELQQLSDMVHKCLRAKASIPVENKKPNHHILRDDINWQKIADTVGTHNHGSCCGKWYYNLQSSLVTDGLWANEDDFLLLQSLLESGACVEEEVEWDSLLDHRPGQMCSTRWKQMVKHLGENRTRQFLDKLDILARRYAPELLESSVNEDSTIKENPSSSAIISDP